MVWNVHRVGRFVSTFSLTAKHSNTDRFYHFTECNSKLGKLHWHHCQLLEEITEMLKHCSSFIPVSQAITATWKAKKKQQKASPEQTSRQGLTTEKSAPLSRSGLAAGTPVQTLGEETSKNPLKLGLLNGLREPWESGAWAWLMFSDSKLVQRWEPSNRSSWRKYWWIFK